MEIIYKLNRNTDNVRIFSGTQPLSFYHHASPLHKHENAEIHLVEKGYLRCTIEGKEYLLNPGDALLIPGGFFHKTFEGPPDRRHLAFQADLVCHSVKEEHFPAEFVSDLFERMMRGEPCISTLYYISVSLANIQTHFVEKEKDYKHEIGVFFDKRHAENVEVKDLASALHLSEMQTQRVLKKYTGMTFGENLRSYRLKVADYLANTTNMPLEEIARKVGYNSYSGFWKAKQKSAKEKRID
jgi:AraC-like DNA-binding protein